MERQIPASVFEPLKPPIYHKTKKPVDKKKYLDELYTKEWLNNYFDRTKTTSKSS